MNRSRHHAIAPHFVAFLRALLLTWALSLAVVAVVVVTALVPGGWMSIVLVLGLIAGVRNSRGGGRGWKVQYDPGESPLHPVVKFEAVDRSPLWDRDLDGEMIMIEPRLVS